MSIYKKTLLFSFLVVGICYANSLPNRFILDDIPIIAANPEIRSISPLKFLSSPYWTKEQNGGIYRPLTILSFSIDYALWQDWPPGFRLTNLLLHVLNGWLVLLLARSLTGSDVTALASMVIYLAHPVHTEAVAGIVGRSELLAAGAFLGSWLLFRQRRTGWAACLFLLSLLSKENAIVLPGVLLLDLWLSRSKCSFELKKESIRLVIIGAVAVLYLVLRFTVLQGIGVPTSAQYLGGEMTTTERWMTSGRVFLKYFLLTFAPVSLAGDYDFNTIPLATFWDWDAWAGLVSVLAMVIGAILVRRINWQLSLGLLFPFIALITVSNWIVPISVLMAERFLYLPMFGVALAGGILFAGIPRRSMRSVIGAGVFVLAVLLCVSHNYVWSDDLTFYGNMVRVAPENAKGRLGYGFALIQAGRGADAERELEEGLRILPDSPALLSTLALARMTPTGCDRSFPLLNRALSINPKHADTLRRLADCLYRTGDKTQAEWMYRQALENTPFPDSLLLFTWGMSLEETGQKAAAVTAYERAALIDPRNNFIRLKIADLKR